MVISSFWSNVWAWSSDLRCGCEVWIFEMWLWGLDFWDVVMGVGFGFVMWLWWVWIWDVGEEKGEKMWEKFAGLLCSSRIWVQVFLFFFFAEAGMVFYERRSEGLKSWRLDQADKERERVREKNLEGAPEQGGLKEWPSLTSDLRWGATMCSGLRLGRSLTRGGVALRRCSVFRFDLWFSDLRFLI